MPIERLPASVLTVYSELLEQAQVFERTAGMEGALPGGLVEKTIGGRRYLYWQIRKGDQTVQRYLGADEPKLRASLENQLKHRHELKEDRAALERLAAMLLGAGLLREEARVAAVLRLLADIGLFRRGAVLVGTQAYRAYSPLLGVHLTSDAARTQDIDVAHAVSVAVAAAEEGAPPVTTALGSLGFSPVPGLDPREPSTSFKVRGRELRVDFLTPAPNWASKRSHEPVHLPGLGLAAWPLPFLDYLIEHCVPALVLAAHPVLVRVPQPARFALHKLWTARRRPVYEATKARKDRNQAAALLEVLAEDRPDDLVEAWRGLSRGAKPRAGGSTSPLSVVKSEITKLPETIRRRLPLEMQERQQGPEAP